MTIKDMDVRVSNADVETKRDKAALSTYRFIRRQVEARGVVDKVDLARQMWDLFFTMEKADLLAAPRRTKALLRENLAFYRAIGVDETTAPSLVLIAS